MNHTFRPELRLLRPLLLFALLAWVFVDIAGEVIEGETGFLDTRVMLALLRPDGTPAGPVWLTDVARDITALGGPALIAIATVGISGFMALNQRRHLAWLTLFSTSGGVLMVVLLKMAFARARPQTGAMANSAYGYSFPSGHAMMSAVVFLTLATLVSRLLPRLRQRLYLMGWAVLLSGLVGLSRIYLGAHWTTDVLAGWAAGAAWALACGLLAQHIDHSGEQAR